MKFKLPFPINNNTIALCFVAAITVIFIIAGIFDVLDYAIIKILLIGLTSGLALITSVILFKKEIKRNRLKGNPQDDYN
ncbi:hypothetical protein [Winogradskyella jejuensis]|uniref:Uncharacterized protein n=1 Tax=Winogradskyella jejuensis TaxID=1089305 RepID=A0A1M5T069_9FLAO|nr:hypothetical protein [Winogradskyella jejuensis]SHH44062.1 hypothetical protein SAMN05444148_2022 [Winogradskyella jejuensis]